MLRKLALMAVGLFPLVGSFASIVWMLCASGVTAEREVSVSVASWFVATASHPIGAFVLVQSLYTALQSGLWTRYRPFSAPSQPEWPFVSVVIPAFNEGPMVERSIRSVIASDYPKERLEVIVVDDGSRDDTFFHMQRLRREAPDLVRLVRFVGNRGKRQALMTGFRAARGEILITIDSDSEVEVSTVREMVAPFLADTKVGAVAGRVAVLNRDTLISRMLEIQYALAFDFSRSAQSSYRCVACCPGALSAFRRELVLPELETWANQKFLGRPVNHGEDQALTNLVLRRGCDTVYQRTAVVHTLAPTSYQQLSRMFVRWDRSYIVEGFSFAQFMFTPYRANNRVLPIITFVVMNLRLVALVWGVIQLPLVFSIGFGPLLRATVAMLIGALFTALYYLRIERSLRFIYGVVYAIYSFLLLQWILPWALITVRDERWGTR